MSFNVRALVVMQQSEHLTQAHKAVGAAHRQWHALANSQVEDEVGQRLIVC